MEEKGKGLTQPYFYKKYTHTNQSLSELVSQTDHSKIHRKSEINQNRESNRTTSGSDRRDPLESRADSLEKAYYTSIAWSGEFFCLTCQ